MTPPTHCRNDIMWVVAERASQDYAVQLSNLFGGVMTPPYRTTFLETRFGTDHFSPIQVATLQAHDQHFSRGQVGGDGHIVLVAVADGFDHLAVIPGVGSVGVGEEEHQIDLIIRNPGIDLLMTALDRKSVV